MARRKIVVAPDVALTPTANGMVLSEFILFFIEHPDCEVYILNNNSLGIAPTFAIGHHIFQLLDVLARFTTLPANIHKILTTYTHYSSETGMLSFKDEKLYNPHEVTVFTCDADTAEKLRLQGYHVIKMPAPYQISHPSLAAPNVAFIDCDDTLLMTALMRSYGIVYNRNSDPTVVASDCPRFFNLALLPVLQHLIDNDAELRLLTARHSGAHHEVTATVDHLRHTHRVAIKYARDPTSFLGDLINPLEGHRGKAIAILELLKQMQQRGEKLPPVVALIDNAVSEHNIAADLKKEFDALGVQFFTIPVNDPTTVLSCFQELHATITAESNFSKADFYIDNMFKDHEKFSEVISALKALFRLYAALSPTQAAAASASAATTDMTRTTDHRPSTASAASTETRATPPSTWKSRIARWCGCDGHQGNLSHFFRNGAVDLPFATELTATPYPGLQH